MKETVPPGSVTRHNTNIRRSPMTRLKLILTGLFLALAVQSYAEDTTSKPGLNCVFFAPQVPHESESPLAGIHDRLPAVAKMAGVSDHSQVALPLDPDKEKQVAQIKEALSGGRVDLLALPFSRTILGKREQFFEIMDQALAINPKMQFLIQIPAPLNIPVRDVKRLSYNSNKFHKSVFKVIVAPLRERYPSNRVSCAYYGQTASEIKSQFDAEQLEGIESLVGEEGVFLTKAGQPGPVLAHLNAMFALSLIYDVDLALTEFDLGYEVDLAAIAAEALKHEADHRPPAPEILTGDGPNIFTLETWDRPWGYTVPAAPKKGLNCLFYGHEFLTSLAEAIEPVAEKGGITDHKMTTFVKSPHDGAPGVAVQMLSVPEKGPDGGKELRALIETEKFDLLGLTYHQHETGELKHYKEWFDYALARNPEAQLLIHLPASADAARRDLDKLNATGDSIRAKFHATVVVPMRKAFPGKKIHFWYSGRVDSEMRRRFEAGELPQVPQLVGKRGIFSVPGGYPGPFLSDLQGLILYSMLYEVELPKKMAGQDGKLDLNTLAAEMIAMEKKKGL
jgi:hypothetical protein